MKTLPQQHKSCSKTLWRPSSHIFSKRGSHGSWTNTNSLRITINSEWQYSICHFTSLSPTRHPWLYIGNRVQDLLYRRLDLTTQARTSFTRNQAWRNKKPLPHKTHFKVINGSTWYYCSHHQAWKRHTSESCLKAKSQSHRSIKQFRNTQANLHVAMADLNIQNLSISSNHASVWRQVATIIRVAETTITAITKVASSITTLWKWIYTIFVRTWSTTLMTQSSFTT
jgi:hypothetical protein